MSYMKYIFIIAILFVSLTSYAQTNNFPLYSSGDYLGGSLPDATDIVSPQLKLQSVSGYVRIAHKSASSNVSAVYNFETGKNAYWGEPSDVGQYLFRGRDLIIQQGKLGIGTTSPDGFQVNTALSSEASQGVNNIRMGILAGTPRLIFDSSGSTPFEIDNAGGQLRIFNPGTVRMVVNSNGNVGIGTTQANSYKLAVAGTIGAWGEVRVFTTGQAFPDYVFDPSYKLPPLEQTEKYVKENRHLPEVPSAKEMEKNGIGLTEMNILLLKKVEELTLYMIEMKKKTESLEKQVEELKGNQKKE